MLSKKKLLNKDSSDKIENKTDDESTKSNIENVYVKLDIPENFEEMLEMLLKNKEALLHAQIINNVHLVDFQKGFIEIRLKDLSDNDIIKKMSSTLEKITKMSWIIKLSDKEGEKTILEQKNILYNQAKEDVKLNPNIAEVFKYFPEATITSIEDD